jgi:predicted nucleic acid-binding protein
MSSTKLFGLIYAELRRLGIGIGAIDSLIASVVMENDETLITRNIRHFSRVPGLKVESY